MVIASGKVGRPLSALASGARCTWFLPPPATSPVAARKKWIAGALKPRGTLHLDAGAARALAHGSSLLPAGVTAVEGRFARGDAVILRGPDGSEIGRGLVAYDHADAARIAGRRSDRIAAILGYSGRGEMVHRDDLVLAGAAARAEDARPR
jgi:glutamate 5-kinase